jgi:capsular polysaccharide transport system ATP-binding protein
MLMFNSATKSFQTLGNRKYILRHLTGVVPDGRRIGVLGPNGAGKTTLLRLIAGSEPLDDGEIIRRGRVSFPIGFTGTFHPDLSAKENVSFLARIYSMDADETVAWVEDFCELGTYFKMPVRTFSSGMFAKLAFATSFAIDFDYYLVDEAIETGDARFRAKCAAAFEKRLKNATLILVSQNMHTIRTFCDTGAVLNNGMLTFFDDLEDAFSEYEALLTHKGNG